MSLDAAAVRTLLRERNVLHGSIKRQRRSLVLATEKAGWMPNDERLERDRAERSRNLRSAEAELVDMDEELMASWR